MDEFIGNESISGESLRDLMNLTGRRALVTGGAKGIGAAIAKRLAEAGAVVTVADIGTEAESGLLSGASGSPSVFSFVTVQCDVTDPDQLVHAMDVAAGDGPEGLSILVNNVGIFPVTGPLVDATDAFVERMLEVNVRSQYSAAREAAKRMHRNGGSIINMASIAGLRGGANITAYSMSKAAIVGLTRSFAAELGPRGIRVNAIAPGVIDTPGVQAQLAPLKASGIDIDAIKAGNPLRIAGQADHVARVALFLASDLSAFVTGQVLAVDGGVTA